MAISNLLTSPLQGAINNKLDLSGYSISPTTGGLLSGGQPVMNSSQPTYASSGLTVQGSGTKPSAALPALPQTSTPSGTPGFASTTATTPTTQSASGAVSSTQTTAPSRTAVQIGNGQTAYYDQAGQAWDSATGGNKVGGTAIATNTYQAPTPTTGQGGLVPPTPPPDQTTQNQYSTSNPPTYPGLVSTVANQGAAPTAADLAAQAQAQDAYNKYQQAVKDMATSQTNEANTIAGINSTPIPLEFQQGRGQVVQSQYAQQQAAIGQEEAGAAAIYNPAIGAAFTGQGQQFGAANNAAGLAQPRQQGYVNLNPLNPDTSGGGTAAGAAATGGATESAYQNALTKGTVQTNIGASGLGDATKQYTEANTYNTTASGQATILQNILDTTGINASNFQDWNKAINNLQGRMGSTNYSQFITGLSELQNAYSQLLSTGGNTPSANDATALAVLNPNSSASQIHASVQTLQKDAYAKLSALYGTAQTYQNITSNTGTSGASGSGGWGSLGD